MNKEQFLLQLKQTGKGKYVNIINAFEEKAQEYSPIEFIQFLCFYFDVNEKEKKEIIDGNYQGIRKSLLSFKKKKAGKLLKDLRTKTQKTTQTFPVETIEKEESDEPSKYPNKDELDSSKQKFKLLKNNQ